MAYTALYMSPSTRTQIYLTSEQRSRLDQIAKRRDASLAELVRQAVDEYLARVDPDPQPALDATFASLPHLKPPSRTDWRRG